MVGDIDEEYGRYLLDLGIRSAMAVPMRLRDRYTGAMIFVSMGSTYGSADLHLAEDYVRVVGLSLENARQFTNAPVLISYMLVILVIGIVLDALVFGAAERAVRRRWGLLESTP